MRKKNRNTVALIPARYGSSRLNAKPLKKIGSKPLLQHVYESARDSNQFDRIIIATDHPLIADIGESIGAEVVLTDVNHQSGTDRCAEAARILDEFDLIVNIQGDEIIRNWTGIDELFSMMREGIFDVGTLACPILSSDELNSSDIVKVVFDKMGKALYFSRATIPFVRDLPDEQWVSNFLFFRHIGIYAYTNRVLQDISSLSPSGLELTERLEQLRWLEHGYDVGVVESPMWESIGIDTEEDLKRARMEFQNG